jgi:hypothetical protein
LRAAALAVLIAVPAAGAAPPAQEERPKIFLEKRIFAETSEGRKSFYEVHTVAEGESLWRILSRKASFAASSFGAMVKDFLRSNPEITDPGRLLPGQRILLPAPPAERGPRPESGKTVLHKVEKGESLIRILRKRGVLAGDLPRYLDAVKTLNEEIRDADRIVAGKSILLPDAGYFSGSAAAESVPEVALTKEAPEAHAPGIAEAARPEAQLPGRTSPPQDAPAVMSARDAGKKEPPGKEEPPAAMPKPPYRGLLADLLAGLGEKWVDRGTLYLPVPPVGEVVLNLEEFPVARFSNGVQALVDFRGGLPAKIRDVIEETWKGYRVVSMEGEQEAGEMIRRLLRASGYHSVKEGFTRPLVIGEGVSITLPARWVVLRTSQSLLAGEVILVKEVPEKPGEELSAVIRYADRIGIRVLPYATDPVNREGFLVGIESEEDDDPPPLAVPLTGVAALDFAFDFLGIQGKKGERLTISGKGGAFQLVVQPERVFEIRGKRFVADAGRMTPAVRSLVKDAGYAVFQVGADEPGRTVFRRILDEAGIPAEDRRDQLLSGGKEDGYEIRVTGTFLSSRELLERRSAKTSVLVRAKIHSATRALLREIGVETVEW